VEIVDGISVFGAVDPGALSQIKTCTKTAYKTALMPDNHKGYGVPIGGVVAYKDAVSPTGVGFDIACGNKAVRIDMPGEELRANIKTIMDDIWKTISFGIGQKNNERVEWPEFDCSVWHAPFFKPLKQLAQNQLGTIGAGNHYVDLFTDELDRVWIGVHFGSRGFGYKTARYFLEAAGAKDGMDVEPCVLSLDDQLGQDYMGAMSFCGDYAYAGRDWVCDRVAKILGAPIVETVHNHHNFAWKERHSGEDLIVVRKGSTPAWPGQRGFVGGTMAEGAVILEGVESPLGAYSLYSTVHGAGRVMGRMDAKGKIDRKTGEVKRVGRVTEEMLKGWVDRSGIELRGGALDESPDCYKRLPEVLAAMDGTVKIIHDLKPVGVAMADGKTYDPFKD
jgi:tRNA-splicing ligase RtcB (3'-phosphate/5'-hydroxy nucleic acid ligase)